MGAEQIGGLGDLLHIPIQSINTAGQEIHHPAGHSLVHVLHIDNNRLVVAQIIRRLGGIVKAAGTE